MSRLLFCEGECSTTLLQGKGGLGRAKLQVHAGWVKLEYVLTHGFEGEGGLSYSDLTLPVAACPAADAATGTQTAARPPRGG